LLVCFNIENKNNINTFYNKIFQQKKLQFIKFNSGG